MIERIDKSDDRKADLIGNHDQVIIRCPQGYKWVPRHIRNGQHVIGYRARIGNYHKEHLIHERSKKYGQDLRPVYIKEDRVIETH